MTIVFIPPSYFRCCYWRFLFTCGSKHCKFNVWTFIAETQRHYLQIRWRPNFGQCPLDWYGATAVCIWRNWRNLAHLKLLAWAKFVYTSNFYISFEIIFYFQHSRRYVIYELTKTLVTIIYRHWEKTSCLWTTFEHLLYVWLLSQCATGKNIARGSQ